MKLVTSPTVISPARTRNAPPTSSSTLVTFGTPSSSASNVLRMRTALDPLVAQPGGDLRQPLGLALLGAERLDHGDAVEALVDRRAELAELVLRGVEEAVDAALVDDVEDDQDREHERPRPGRAASR